jgi:hypothetical protein
VLAHLIHSEIGWINYASEIIGGNEGAYDDYSGNLQARIEATLTIYPTKNELIKALKTCHAETVSMLAHVPEEFLTHNGRYWKLVYQANQNPYHQQTHLEQIHAALKSAQG